MTKYNYAFQKFDKEHMTRAAGKDMPISSKQSIEVCKFLKNMNVEKAKKYLNDVIALKKPIPFTRFTNGLGHKKGMASGRYPTKTCKNILQLIESAEINGQQKGLNTANLIIVHICAQRASRPMHYGRHRGEFKRSHIEVVLEERKIEKKEKKSGKKPEIKKEIKTEKKVEQKPEVKEEKKPEIKKEEKKPEQIKKEDIKTEEPKEEKKPEVKEEKKPETKEVKQ